MVIERFRQSSLFALSFPNSLTCSSLSTRQSNRRSNPPCCRSSNEWRRPEWATCAMSMVSCIRVWVDSMLANDWCEMVHCLCRPADVRECRGDFAMMNCTARRGSARWHKVWRLSAWMSTSRLDLSERMTQWCLYVNENVQQSTFSSRVQTHQFSDPWWLAPSTDCCCSNDCQWAPSNLQLLLELK